MLIYLTKEMNLGGEKKNIKRKCFSKYINMGGRLNVSLSMNFTDFNNC